MQKRNQTARRANPWLGTIVAMLLAAAQAQAFCYGPAPNQEQVPCALGQRELQMRSDFGQVLPQAKQTRLDKYVTAAQVPELLLDANVLFVDVRSRGEFNYVGVAHGVQAHIPFMDITDRSTWPAQTQSYALQHNPQFVSALARQLHEHGLDANASIVLICRSGERSAQAANALQEAGYGNVYTVVDGFEGDLATNGRREVNGWKNAGLPWAFGAPSSLMP